MWQQATEAHRTNLLSARGPGTGSIWVSGYSTAKELLPNTHCAVATNERLGALGDETHTTCQAKQDAEEEKISYLAMARRNGGRPGRLGLDGAPNNQKDPRAQNTRGDGEPQEADGDGTDTENGA